MFTLIKKDIAIFITDRRSVLIFFILPIVLVSLFASIYGVFETSDVKSKKIKLVIIDNDKSKLSRNIITEINSKLKRNIEEKDSVNALNELKKGKINGVLFFKKEFEISVKNNKNPEIEFFYDISKEFEIIEAKQIIKQVLFDKVSKDVLLNNLITDVKSDFADAGLGISDYITQKIRLHFKAMDGGNKAVNAGFVWKEQRKVVGGNQSPLLIQAVAGISVMLLLFGIMGIGASLIDEIEKGTFYRLLSFKISPLKILFSKFFTATILSIIQLLILFNFSCLVFGLPVYSHLFATLVLIILTSLSCSAIGIFLASFCKTRQQVMNISIFVFMTFSAIGGSMIPLFLLPQWIENISVLSVNYWVIESFYDVYWRNLSITEFPEKLIVLSSFTMLFLVLSLIFFNFSKKNLK